MLIYTSTISSRLQYSSDFLGKEIAGKPFELTSDPNYYQQYRDVKINYSNSRITDSEFWLEPHALLFENKIVEQVIECFEANGQKAFFKTRGDFPFDIFAASFYLISRYEEYLPHKKDMYGRYAHENSLAFRHSFLNIPLVNYWIRQLRELLQAKFPGFNPPPSQFVFLPTYDIDIAWSYKNKGWRRTLGGSIQLLIKGHWKQLIERIKVLRGKQKDPFDTYGWLNDLHQKYHLKPYYFFLLAERTGRYDKNIHPGQKALQNLIRDHLIRYPVAIHPSWRSGDENSLLRKEIAELSRLTGNKVVSSRQHYIRFSLPETFRRLIEQGIQFDFSMGYGSINGFRASIASPFYWYDLSNEKQTGLVLFPFCFMDANSLYEQKYSALQALEEMRHFYQVIKSISGTYIMIWHNNFFGTDELFEGWKDIYKQFIIETSQQEISS